MGRGSKVIALAVVSHSCLLVFKHSPKLRQIKFSSKSKSCAMRLIYAMSKLDEVRVESDF